MEAPALAPPEVAIDLAAQQAAEVFGAVPDLVQAPEAPQRAVAWEKQVLSAKGKYLIIQPLIQPSIQPSNIIRGDKIIRQSLGETGPLSQGV